MTKKNNFVYHGVMKNKIILTGYRATGKSSVGRLLAAKLHFTFLDTDQEIEKRNNCTISEMVSQRGWDFFREQENKLLTELCPANRVIIATGGGAILHEQAWARLRQTALTIWLTASTEIICQRLAADMATAGQRPSLTGNDILQEVSSVLKKRTPLYENGSDITINTETELTDIVRKIAELWQNQLQ